MRSSSITSFHPTLQETLDRILVGEPLSHAEVHALIEADNTELPALCVAAKTLRERYKPYPVTYSRKVFIPLTALCRDKCGCYILVKFSGDPAARTLEQAVECAGNKGAKAALAAIEMANLLPMMEA